MAIVKTITNVQAVAILQKGLDEEGGAITKNKIISGIARGATDQGIYNLIETVGSLQSLPLVGIETRTTTSLIDM